MEIGRTYPPTVRLSGNTIEPQLIDVHGVAAMLAIDKRSVERRVKDGELPPSIKIGRLRRWRVIDIQSCIDSKAQEAIALALKSSAAQGVP